MLNLLNAFNDCTVLKYLDTHKSYCINGKFRPDCCFVYKNININILKEHKCLQDFVVCTGEFKKSNVTSETSIGQILHYLHLLSDIQNRKKMYGFLVSCKQITFYYVEKEYASNSYKYYQSQDLDLFNNYSETSSSADTMITNEEWKKIYLNQVTWKIFTNFLTMNDNFYEYTVLNIDPSIDLLYDRYNIRKKLGNGLTSMVYLLVKNENNSLNDDIKQCVMKISKSSLYTEYFLNEVTITNELKQLNSDKLNLFFQDILHYPPEGNICLLTFP
ncbi:unnamed protein product [Rotaria magnacalcarata]|uniref:Uncharacterized protein n=2 Tax=Rotaria magnacalcarata TaxID=392030 RepID=A0A816QS41_9BILA|nr:unnamed protein product [Rotaria magnacalcarata]CAF4587341.1 unnamed protein product [Rotaria magnacalcarata]